MLNINLFYQYVFNDLISTRMKSILLSSVMDDKKKILLENYKELVRQQFKDITTYYGYFRPLLREVGSSKLETLLYGNATEKLPQIKKLFPANKIIIEQFRKLNDEYKYFTNVKFLSKIEESFLIIFKGCKLIADFIENNNDDLNEVSFLHAYKILVLFGASKDKKNPFLFFQKFIHSYAHNATKPIHDCLIHVIAINDPPINLSVWRAFIVKNGFKAITIFSRAPEIQMMLKKDPQSFTQAENTLLQLQYKRSNEHLKLAKLCSKYKMSEKIFDTCLQVEAKRKKSENLPKGLINGNDLGYQGYYLTNLPINDLNGYILGELVDDCQSMGGHSQQCVIDGITLEDDGFYVLLKQIHKKDDNCSPLLSNGDINYQDFEIVGQAYACISENNNLFFDSWENLRPHVDDQVVVPMLKKFGTEIVNAHPTIQRVTIGRGGKTPTAFDLKTKPEKIKEGTPYHDSREQSIISFKNEDKIKSIFPQLCSLTVFKHFDRKTLEQLFLSDYLFFYNDYYHLGFDIINSCFLSANTVELWQKLPDLSIDHIKKFIVLMISNWSELQILLEPTIIKTITKNNFISFLTEDNRIKCENYHIYNCLQLLKQHNLLEDSHWAFKKEYQIFSYLDKAMIFTHENLKLFFEAKANNQHESIAYKMNRIGILNNGDNYLTDKKFKLLCQIIHLNPLTKLWTVTSCRNDIVNAIDKILKLDLFLAALPDNLFQAIFNDQLTQDDIDFVKLVFKTNIGDYYQSHCQILHLLNQNNILDTANYEYISLLEPGIAKSYCQILSCLDKASLINIQYFNLMKTPEIHRNLYYVEKILHLLENKDDNYLTDKKFQLVLKIAENFEHLHLPSTIQQHSEYQKIYKSMINVMLLKEIDHWTKEKLLPLYKLIHCVIKYTKISNDKNKIINGNEFIKFPLEQTLKVILFKDPSFWNESLIHALVNYIDTIPNYSSFLTKLYKNGLHNSLTILLSIEKLSTEDIALYTDMLAFHNTTWTNDDNPDSTFQDSIKRQLAKNQAYTNFFEKIQEIQNSFKSTLFSYDYNYPTVQSQIINNFELFSKLEQNKYNDPAEIIIKWHKYYQETYNANPFELLSSYMYHGCDFIHIEILLIKDSYSIEPLFIEAFKILLKDYMSDELSNLIFGPLSTKTYLNTVKLMHELINYMMKRISLANYNGIVSPIKHRQTMFGHYDAGQKILAAQKFISYLQRNPIAFTEEEVAALKEGQLGKIYNKSKNDLTIDLPIEQSSNQCRLM